jgi:hypothetical protein
MQVDWRFDLRNHLRCEDPIVVLEHDANLLGAFGSNVVNLRCQRRISRS